VRASRRDRGAGCGGRPDQAARTRIRGRELLTGIAAAQLADEDFLTGLDRQRADAAGQQITPVPGLASTTALLAATMAAWLHQLTARTAGEDILAGHGVRGGKAMIATLRWR
jgi:hypothetical protein